MHSVLPITCISYTFLKCNSMVCIPSSMYSGHNKPQCCYRSCTQSALSLNTRQVHTTHTHTITHKRIRMRRHYIQTIRSYNSSSQRSKSYRVHWGYLKVLSIDTDNNEQYVLLFPVHLKLLEWFPNLWSKYNHIMRGGGNIWKCNELNRKECVPSFFFMILGIQHFPEWRDKAFLYPYNIDQW